MNFIFLAIENLELMCSIRYVVPCGHVFLVISLLSSWRSGSRDGLLLPPYTQL